MLVVDSFAGLIWRVDIPEVGAPSAEVWLETQSPIGQPEHVSACPGCAERQRHDHVARRHPHGEGGKAADDFHRVLAVIATIGRCVKPLSGPAAVVLKP